MIEVDTRTDLPRLFSCVVVDYCRRQFMLLGHQNRFWKLSIVKFDKMTCLLLYLRWFIGYWQWRHFCRFVIKNLCWNLIIRFLFSVNTKISIKFLLPFNLVLLLLISIILSLPKVAHQRRSLIEELTIVRAGSLSPRVLLW